MQSGLVFQHEDDRRSRTFDIDIEPWFVLNDVCRALDIKHPHDAEMHLDDDAKRIARVETDRGEKSIRIINQSGLHALMLRSDKPVARDFRRWLAAEPRSFGHGDRRAAGPAPSPSIHAGALTLRLINAWRRRLSRHRRLVTRTPASPRG